MSNDRLRVTLSTPRVVAETAVGRCWYPDILKFATGEFLLTHSLNPDANENLYNAQAVYVSPDGGSFDFAYDVNGFHNGGGEPRVSLPDGRIVGTSTFLRPDPPNQGRRFLAHRWTYDRGGKRYMVEPWGAVVEGLPRGVLLYPPPSRTWWSRINWFSDIVVRADGAWVSTLSMRFTDDTRETTVALLSVDEGYHWRYLSTVAGPDDLPDADEGFDEPCLIEMADGGLLCISRVGSGAHQPLARTISDDGGRTWSPLDRLAAYSVAPQIARLTNGTYLLATGRPGLFLWHTRDLRGAAWEPIDLMAHHNAAVPDWPMTAEQTTAYTALVEASPNRAFLVYDRTPEGWGAVAASSGERSQIWLVEVEAISCS